MQKDFPLTRQRIILFVQMFFKILILSLILLCIAMLGMALNILVKKKGRFPAYQVGHNRDMRKMGITCVKHDEIRCHNKNTKEIDCAGCKQPS